MRAEDELSMPKISRQRRRTTDDTVRKSNQIMLKKNERTKGPEDQNEGLWAFVPPLVGDEHVVLESSGAWQEKTSQHISAGKKEMMTHQHGLMNLYCHLLCTCNSNSYSATAQHQGSLPLSIPHSTYRPSCAFC